MTRKIYLVTAIIVMVLGLVAYNRLEPMFRAKKIVHLMEVGGQGFVDGKDVKAVCPVSKGHKSIFCFEGFFLHRAIADLARQPADLFQLKKIVITSLADIENFTPTEKATWAIAFGIAYGRSGWDLSFAKAAFAEHYILLAKYFIDGWAMSFSEKQGGMAALEKVKRVFGEQFLSACAWGLGRASFFGLPKNADSLLSMAQVQSGFDFAKTFTKEKVVGDKTILLQESKAIKIAELLKKIIIGEPTLSIENTALTACMSGYHISECDEIE